MTIRLWEAQALVAYGGRRRVSGCVVRARDAATARDRAKRVFARLRVLGPVRVRPWMRGLINRPWPQGAF